MTLGRQLLTGITAAFVVLLLGIEAIYVHTARSHLADQLDAHANETATSLALTIGSRMQVLDSSLVSTIVNPVFDRGHFRLVEVRGSDGSLVSARQLAAQQVDLPPNWFVGLVGFEPPIGRSLISAGWKQLGRVTVEVHPEFAYKQLWTTALATLTWLSALFAVGLIAMRFYLAGILRPLRQIEQAAMAIGDRKFVSIDSIPSTRELQRVTSAINSLSAKVRDAIEMESLNAERLRREAFEDPVTGKLNRRGFENAATAATVATGEVFSGALTLFSLNGLEEINRAVGLSKADAVLKQLGNALDDPKAPGRLIVGRWQGPVFAAFVENGNAQAVLSWASSVCDGITGSLHAAGLPEAVVVRAGVAHFTGGDVSLPQLSRQAEAALVSAIAAKERAVLASLFVTSPELDVRSEIESAIASNRISVLFQKVMGVPEGQILQYEFFSKLVNSQGQPIPAGVFLPVAGQHGLLPRLDLRGVELALAAIKTNRNLPQTLAVNISLQAVLDAGFLASLETVLKSHSSEARRIVFELTNAAASKSPAAVKAFSARLRAFGTRVALDNCELDRNAVAAAHDLMPAYVKLAPVYTQELGAREDSRIILQAMLRVFRPLEIPVIAQGVEDPALIPLLTEMGISGYQGFVLGKPEPLAD